jgi:hypothetical protein
MGLWNVPGVSERMWSVNLVASVSAEYLTPGGYFGRLSEELGSLMTDPEVTEIPNNWYRSRMGEFGICLGACWSAREKFECT